MFRGERQQEPHSANRFSDQIANRFTMGLITIALLAGVVVSIRRPTHVSSSSIRTYTTTAGERATVVLQDGSRVILAPLTTLRVPMPFGSDERVVELVGQANFAVDNAIRHPFIVHTRHATVQVLGTVFDVQNYVDDRTTHVVVQGGRIAVAPVAAPANRVVVSAGYVGEVSDSVGVVLRNLTPDGDWREGHLVFHLAPVSEVLATVSRWYGYHFQLADTAMAGRRVTTSLDYRSSTDALGLLRLLLDVDMTVDGDVITLHPRRGTGTPTGARRSARDSFSIQSEIGR